jgi:2-polyprenyl-6-methoxyphenol hydroxylase-like FAD-dependent oxidoreductase
MSCDPQVLVSGAGPTGLTLALWLARLGVSVRIFDRSSGPGETSRALAVQSRTLEFHRMIGVIDDVLTAGVRVDRLNVLTPRGGTRPLDLGEFGRGVSQYDHAFVLPQDIHEQILVEHLHCAGVNIERETELTGFDDVGSGVMARLRKGDTTETVRADYLVGADGAHSFVRHALGIGFPGGAYDQSFYVADVEGQGRSLRNAMDVVLGAYGFAIVLPVRQSGTIRLIGVVPKKYECVPKIKFHTIRAEVERDTRVKVEKVRWFSTYRVHHRVAERFRQGRVFIAGDAGHIHSPAGGQGMNTGMGDAVNLAWKLAAVLQSRADKSILDSYEAERLAFAHVLIRGTDRAFRFATSLNPLVGTFRRNLFVHLVRWLLKVPQVQKRFFNMNAQTAIAYPGSHLSVGVAGKVRAGDRLPYLRFGNTDNHAPLAALDWQVHVYGTASADFRNTVAEAGFTVLAFDWTSQAKAAGIPCNAAFMIRPDGHVGLALSTQSSDVFRSYVRSNSLISRRTVAALSRQVTTAPAWLSSSFKREAESTPSTLSTFEDVVIGDTK